MVQRSQAANSLFTTGVSRVRLKTNVLVVDPPAFTCSLVSAVQELAAESEQLRRRLDRLERAASGD